MRVSNGRRLHLGGGEGLGSRLRHDSWSGGHSIRQGWGVERGREPATAPRAGEHRKSRHK